MRVLCVTSHSDRPEAETFIGLKKMGVDLHVMCSAASLFYKRLNQAGVPVTALEVQSRIDLNAIRQIRQRLRRIPFHILHGFDNKTVSNAVLAAGGLPVRVVAYRGIVGNVSFFNPGSWMTYLHPKVERVICVAHAVRRHFLNMRLAGLRLPPGKFVTIYKGHSLDWYQQPPVDLGPFGIPDRAFVAGCIANYRPRKGIQILIEAVRYLPVEAPIHLLLVGDMNAARLMRQIDRSPYKDRIHLAGYRSDAPAVIASCQAFVLPSLRREGLPKGVIEAMAYGIPPIVTDSGGSPELVVHRQSGLIVASGSAREIADAVLFLYQNPQAAGQIGNSARHRIRDHFRIEDTVEKTFDLYKELIPG